jgi:hypothetical protein
MSQALRKITGAVSRGACMVFINQVREKIGVMFGNNWEGLVDGRGSRNDHGWACPEILFVRADRSAAEFGA